MQTKLTLRIDEDLIERAKAHARQSGKSVSQLVADYLQMLPQPRPTQPRLRTPIVESLRGALAGSGLDEEDYRRHLEEKYPEPLRDRAGESRRSGNGSRSELQEQIAKYEA